MGLAGQEDAKGYEYLGFGEMATAAGSAAAGETLSDSSTTDLLRENFLWGWGHPGLVSLLPLLPTHRPGCRRALWPDSILFKRCFPERGLL